MPAELITCLQGPIKTPSDSSREDDPRTTDGPQRERQTVHRERQTDSERTKNGLSLRSPSVYQLCPTWLPMPEEDQENKKRKNYCTKTRRQTLTLKQEKNVIMTSSSNIYRMFFLRYSLIFFVFVYLLPSYLKHLIEY